MKTITTSKPNQTDSIRLTLASPEKIREWSYGEVTKPETINYRTGRSERSGLFDERIFGPEKDYQCYCGKYRGVRYKGIVCEKCGVEVTRAIVRRERMGHIELASPVSHIWMLRGIPSRMSLLFGISVTDLEKVIYFAGYIVTRVEEGEREKILAMLDTEFKSKMKTLTTEEDRDRLRDLFATTKKEIQTLVEGQVLSEVQYHQFSFKYATLFEAGIGADAIYNIFKSINLEKLEQTLEADLEDVRATIRPKIEQRLQLVRSLLRADLKPEWMFLKVIPIIPPALRPMVALEGGRHATSDINDLYRRVINRNNRLKKLMDIGAPDVILRNEKRILQEAVDSLIDNSIRKHSGSVAMSQSQRRQLKSLADNLKGKQGLFRGNLLGKRVDYSGRSVIVVGPNLALNQCGLPKFMALELFRPFVISEIIARELAFNIRGAGKLIEEATPEVWEILEDVIRDKYVLLNRAPTLHRLSIQAFKPLLIEGKAIQVHPLVCSAFNADFDGDQMAVHVPLSKEAQREAKMLIASNRNLLKPQTGSPIVNPSQDIVLGCYWMTKFVENVKGEGKIFADPNSAITAYDFNAVDFRAKIKVVGTPSSKYDVFKGQPFETSVGRLLFNSILPQDFEYINHEMTKKQLSKLIATIINRYGIDATPPVLDKIKNFGFKYVTHSGSSFGIVDARVPEGKPAIVAEGKREVAKVISAFNDGLITDEERYRKTIEIWEDKKNQIGDLVKEHIRESESIADMVISGARGDYGSLNQVSGMKGVIVNVSGEELDFPIISSYKEGLSPLEYFINTHSARKGLADTALNTAKAGYLTRRLVDVAQDIVVREEDCGTRKNIVVKNTGLQGEKLSLVETINGRISAEDIIVKGETLVKKGDMIHRDMAERIESAGITEMKVRSPLMCETRHGVCRNCYGWDMGRQGLVKLGEAVGIVAAQAIGEPGTQLTLRTFHTGGVTGEDITQGLPRVEELFERRTPKIPAVITEIDGTIAEIKIDENKRKTIVVLADKGGKGKNEVEHDVDPRRYVTVKKGEHVFAGQLMTDGSADIREIYQHGGQLMAQQYIIEEINKVYELQSSAIIPKHLELIARQMFSRRKIIEPGDTLFTTGEVVENMEFERENERVGLEGGAPSKGVPVAMGISEVSLSTKSWLSSASFQHTTRTLVTNAIRGERDELRGLKENVIIGNLIPAGTGFTDEFVDMSDIRAENKKEAEIERQNREEYSRSHERPE